MENPLWRPLMGKSRKKKKKNVRLNDLCKGRLTWSPKRVDSTNQKRLPVNANAHRDVFLERRGKHIRLACRWSVVRFPDQACFIIRC